MKTINVKKLYKGNIDIRSYVVDKCIENGESIEVTLEGREGKMILSPEDLKDKLIGEPTEIKSQFNINSYTLMSYKWQPK
jgi:hypothetical protein